MLGGSGVEGSVVGLRLGPGIVSILKFSACWSSLDQYASSSFSIALSNSRSRTASFACALRSEGLARRETNIRNERLIFIMIDLIPYQ
jgi:hypothetical protein